MKHLSLFSGIGGFDLAAEWMGWQNVAQVEKDEFCRQVLKKNFPKTKQYEDIHRLVVDVHGNLCYCDCDELPAKQEIQSGCQDVFPRAVNSGDSELLWDNSASNVENSKKEGCPIQEQTSLWEKESFLQGDKGQPEGSQHNRKSDSKRNLEKKNSLRKVQGHGRVQGWKKQDTGASSRLQQAPRGNVVVPKMPSSMAQSEQSNSHQINATKPFLRTCQRQHKRVATRGEISLLTGGFP